MLWVVSPCLSNPIVPTGGVSEVFHGACFVHRALMRVRKQILSRSAQTGVHMVDGTDVQATGIRQDQARGHTMGGIVCRGVKWYGMVW